MSIAKMLHLIVFNSSDKREKRKEKLNTWNFKTRLYVQNIQSKYRNLSIVLLLNIVLLVSYELLSFYAGLV